MKKLYGLDGWEILRPSINDALEQIEEGWDSIEDMDKAMEFPFNLLVFAPRKLPDVKWLAEMALEHLLSNIDDEYGNPDESTTVSKKLLEASEAFAKVFREEYPVWMCEPTGEKIVITKEIMEKGMSDE